jgi:hypothetical protein
MRRIRKVYNRQFSTVCEELYRLKLLGEEEWNSLKRYEDTVPDVICIAYRALIQPIIALMRLFPVLVPIAHTSARYLWIDRAIRLGRTIEERE